MPSPIFKLCLGPEMAVSFWRYLCYQTETETMMAMAMAMGKVSFHSLAAGKQAICSIIITFFPSLRHVSFSFCSPAQFLSLLLQHFFHISTIFVTPLVFIHIWTGPPQLGNHCASDMTKQWMDMSHMWERIPPRNGAHNLAKEPEIAIFASAMQMQQQIGTEYHGIIIRWLLSHIL